MKTPLQNLIILTSPPASGKTYWISSLQEALGTTPVLVISPLRALADECRQRWKNPIIVMTPEEWLSKKVICDVVIFDEFHLFFYWGDSFRPAMWEMFFEISQKAHLTFFLTATLSESMKNEILLFNSQFDDIRWMDFGNQALKCAPHVYFKAASRKFIEELIFVQAKKQGVNLIFCKYREEVFQMERKLLAAGYSCLTCVGGESQYMAANLERMPTPDFIISTTVLSHGVNLPKIEKIFFTYKIENIDFWIQMVARGGRKGEEFQVFALEKPFGIEWSAWKNFLRWMKFYIQLKMSSFFSFKSIDFC